MRIDFSEYPIEVPKGSVFDIGFELGADGSAKTTVAVDGETVFERTVTLLAPQPPSNERLWLRSI